MHQLCLISCTEEAQNLVYCEMWRTWRYWMFHAHTWTKNTSGHNNMTWSMLQHHRHAVQPNITQHHTHNRHPHAPVRISSCMSPHKMMFFCTCCGLSDCRAGGPHRVDGGGAVRDKGHHISLWVDSLLWMDSFKTWHTIIYFVTFTDRSKSWWKPTGGQSPPFTAVEVQVLV